MSETPATRLKILFVCSRNHWRSPTAAKIFRDSPVIAARSAGTSAGARHRVNDRDLGWADLVLVMERHHRDALRTRFPAEARKVPIEVLEIPDEYEFMDEELISELRAKVSVFLQKAP